MTTEPIASILPDQRAWWHVRPHLLGTLGVLLCVCAAVWTLSLCANRQTQQLYTLLEIALPAESFRN